MSKSVADIVPPLVVFAPPSATRLWDGAQAAVPVVVLELPDASAEDANTVQLAWSGSTPCRVIVRMSDDPTPLAAARTTLSDVWDGLSLDAGLAAEFALASGVSVADVVPATYATTVNSTGGSSLYLYGQSGYFERATLFLRTAGPVEADVDPVSAALAAHRAAAQRLNNPEWTFTRAYQGEEVEVKFTFQGEFDIYAESVAALRALRAGRLEGFIEHPLKAFWASERRTRMFEIMAPDEDRGYISFTDTPEPGVYIEKVKRFSREALVRRETVTKGIAVEGGLDEDFKAYALRAHGFRVRPLGVMLRDRFDIDFESLPTGNVFGMMFDNCSVEGVPGQRLRQCEVEYLETRTLGSPDSETILTQLQQVVSWLTDHFHTRDLKFDVGFRSKLGFMQDAATEAAQ